MKVGLDWDGTVSADPEAFKGVVLAFLDAGHEVSVVTWRVPPKDGEIPTDMLTEFLLWGFKLPIVYCSGKAKRDCYQGDIWIEDNPAAVLFSLDRTPRFVEDARDYEEDVMLCENKFGSLQTTWKVLNPKNIKE